MARLALASLIAVTLNAGLAVALPPPPSLVQVTQAQMLERVATLRREGEGAPSNVYVGALGTRSEGLLVVSEIHSRPGVWIAWPEKTDAPLGDPTAKLVRLDLMTDEISRWTLSSVESAFTLDLGADQTPDIVLMTIQMAGAGPEAAVEFPFNYVFRWRDGRYVYASELESKVAKLAKVSEVRRVLEPLTRRKP